MNISRIAAIIFAVITVFVVVFQIALALGAPWGAYAMGGAFPGQFPPAMRVSAGVQAIILALVACVVLARAGVALSSWSGVARWLIWVIVALLAVSVVLNLITPSSGERMIWAPVAALLFICCLLIAIGKPATTQ
jgi:hypothetical protein